MKTALSLKTMTTQEILEIQDVIIDEIIEGIRKPDSTLTERMLSKIIDELTRREYYTQSMIDEVDWMMNQQLV